MRIAAIVAMSTNRVIGYNNQLPWHLPADLKHFKKLTIGNPILMGRKTYQSLGRPLPGRSNIVITRDVHFQALGCIVVTSISAALEAVSYSKEVFVIGGGELFQQMLPQIQQLYLTIVHHHFQGDTFFPELNLNEWRELERIDHKTDAENPFDYSFITLEKK